MGINAFKNRRTRKTEVPLVDTPKTDIPKTETSAPKTEVSAPKTELPNKNLTD